MGCLDNRSRPFHFPRRRRRSVLYFDFVKYDRLSLRIRFETSNVYRKSGVFPLCSPQDVHTRYNSPHIHELLRNNRTLQPVLVLQRIRNSFVYSRSARTKE